MQMNVLGSISPRSNWLNMYKNHSIILCSLVKPLKLSLYQFCFPCCNDTISHNAFYKRSRRILLSCSITFPTNKGEMILSIRTTLTLLKYFHSPISPSTWTTSRWLLLARAPAGTSEVRITKPIHTLGLRAKPHQTEWQIWNDSRHNAFISPPTALIVILRLCGTFI